MELSLESLGPVLVSLGAATAVAGAAATYFVAKSLPEPTCVPPIDLSNQSVVLKDGMRGSRLMPEGELIETLYSDTRTLYDMFQRGLKISGNRPCLGARTGPNLEYEWLTYQEVNDRAVAFGSFMLGEGITSGSETIIGIFSINRIEWVLSEKACSSFNIIPVALYDTLGDQAIQYIVKQTQMQLLVCDTAKKANHVLELVGEEKILKTIVVMENVDDVDLEAAIVHGVRVISFQDALEKGGNNLKKVSPPSPDDIALICYTSGTTGNPKGVVVKHKQALANEAAIAKCLQCYRALGMDDVHLSYLPLPHMFERLGQTLLLSVGARIGFFQGDVKLLLDDAKTLKPTTFFAVPRVLNKIYDRVMAGVHTSKLKSTLMNWGLAAKERELKNFVIRKDSIWDKIIFHKVQALLGGRVELVITGSAPLEKKVLTFFRCALGCMVVEAYGQSEATAGVTMTIPGEYEAGHVGAPLPCNFVKLVDAPEEGYFAKDGKGEVYVRGYNTTSGYYKLPEKTAEVFLEDGWLCTGDIGEWLPNGCLKIIDRRKNLFKLSQGEYIAPEKIEGIICRSKYVEQAFVEGSSLESCLMAVIVPDKEVLMLWAREHGLTGSYTELCDSEAIRKLILCDINSLGKAAGLKSFELIKDIIVQEEPFSVENDLLTPTFKTKRPALRKYFKDQIEGLYKKQTAN